jgi:hypothetical protein
MAKDSLAEDDVGVLSRRNEIPSVIAKKSTILLGHSLEPVGILEHRMCGGGNRRVPVDRSMHVKTLMGRDMYVGGAARVMHGLKGFRSIVKQKKILRMRTRKPRSNLGDVINEREMISSYP